MICKTVWLEMRGLHNFFDTFTFTNLVRHIQHVHSFLITKNNLKHSLHVKPWSSCKLTRYLPKINAEHGI